MTDPAIHLSPGVLDRLAATLGPGESTDFVAEADAAERLGVTVRTMARWRADGRIAWRTLPGGHVWYHPDDLAVLFAPAPGGSSEGDGEEQSLNPRCPRRTKGAAQRSAGRHWRPSSPEAT